MSPRRRRDIGQAPPSKVKLVRVHYLGETELTVTGPATKRGYPFGPERLYSYIWEEDAPKFVPTGKALGSPLFEVASG